MRVHLVLPRDSIRILPVVTGGDFGWADGDVTGDAVPDALGGVFSEEPRWVDVRWAKDEEQLDLQDPRLADSIADIASTIRGIPKDELASEEVRQHRRTVRTLSGLRRLVDNERLSDQRAARFRTVLWQADIRRHPHTPLAESIWSLRSRVTAYDATYLALAAVLDAPLVTTDRKLARLSGLPCTVEAP